MGIWTSLHTLLKRMLLASITDGYAKLCEQIANEQQPMKCVCRGMKDIQKLNGDWTQKEARVEFYNNRWGEEDIPKE